MRAAHPLYGHDTRTLGVSSIPRRAGLGETKARRGPRFLRECRPGWERQGGYVDMAAPVHGQTRTTGVQVIARAAEILRILGTSDRGMSLCAPLADATGLARSTVHRIVIALAAENLVAWDPSAAWPSWGSDSSRWRSSRRHRLRDMVRPYLESLLAARRRDRRPGRLARRLAWCSSTRSSRARSWSSRPSAPCCRRTARRAARRCSRHCRPRRSIDLLPETLDRLHAQHDRRPRGTAARARRASG